MLRLDNQPAGAPEVETMTLRIPMPRHRRTQGLLLATTLLRRLDVARGVLAMFEAIYPSGSGHNVN
jgi:hypothetical protein